MKENIYKQARLKAAENNPELKTVEKAYTQVNISREKLLMIEQTDPNKKRANPDVDDVARMVEVYNAPELANYYCVNQCPLGNGKPNLIYDNLDRISVGLMSALHFLEDANDKIYDILEDGQVTDDEKEEFIQIVDTLNKIAYNANSLELWAKKNGVVEK